MNVKIEILEKRRGKKAIKLLPEYGYDNNKKKYSKYNKNQFL